MSYQKKTYWCGPASLQIALRIHGVRMGQARLARIMNTTEDGSDEHDIITCLNELGVSYDEFATDHRNDARNWLLNFAPTVPLILCVDRWSHWVCVAGQCGDRLWLFDPERTENNVKQNGAWPLLTRTILKRWRNAKSSSDDNGTLYYGIAILPPNRKGT